MDTEPQFEASNAKFFTISDLEYLTGKNFRTIKKRLGDLEPVRSAGRAKFYESRAALARVFSSDEAKTSYDLNLERARLAAMQADEKQLDYLKKTGALIPAELMEREWSSLVTAVKSKLLALPTRVAPILKGLETPEEVEHNLRPFILEALEELAHENADHNGGASAPAES